MQLSEIYIKNYKAFKDGSVLEIKPITLIFGENNAGKSSLARLLPSLKKSCNQKNSGVNFYPVEVYKSLPTKDFVYGGASDFQIGLNFEGFKIKYTILVNSNCMKVNDFSYESNIEGTPYSLFFELDSEKGLYFFEDNKFHAIDLTFKGLVPEIRSISFDSNLSQLSRSDEIHEKFESIRNAFFILLNKIYWIAPLRYIPQPIERLGLEQVKMSPDGNEATQILAHSKNSDSLVFDTVRDWFLECFNQELEINLTGLNNHQMFTVELNPISSEKDGTNRRKIRVTIADCGTGISQILSIIVLGAQAMHGKLGEGPYLVFENPELHLHDSTHDNLGRFFAKVANSAYQPNIIIETHSENILISFQLEIAKKNIRKESVIINWSKKIDDSSLIDKVDFDDHGLLSNKWPLDTFKTGSKLARELFDIIDGDQS